MKDPRTLAQKAEEEKRLADKWESRAKGTGMGAGFLEKAGESWRLIANYYEIAAGNEKNPRLSKQYALKASEALTKASGFFDQLALTTGTPPRPMATKK